MGAEMKLSAEMARVLEKRIATALRKAKYHPATVDPVAAAAEVVKPYLTAKGVADGTASKA